MQLSGDVISLASVIPRVLTLKKYLQECETRLVGTLAKELLNQVNDRFFHPENEILPGDDPNDEFQHVAAITDHPDYSARPMLQVQCVTR